MANINENLIISTFDRVYGVDKSTGELLFILDELKDGSLENGSEVVWVTGKAGARIAGLDRNKTAKFSCNNAYVSMSAIGVQTGSAVVKATSLKPIEVPELEYIEVAKGGTEVTLKNTPIGATGAEIPFIYLANNDGSQGDKFEIAAVAAADKFKLDPATKKLTLPTELFTAAGGRIIVPYTYAATVGSKVVNNNENFAKTIKLVVDATMLDTCDTSIEYQGRLVLPNAKTEGTFTIGAGDGEPEAHGFSAEAMIDKCGKDRDLWSIAAVE